MIKKIKMKDLKVLFIEPDTGLYLEDPISVLDF